MDNKLIFDKKNTLIFLYSSKLGSWENKTNQITVVYKAYYHGRHSGYNVYFQNSNQYFFYTLNNLLMLRRIQTIDVSDKDVYVNRVLTSIKTLEYYEQGVVKIDNSDKTYQVNMIEVTDKRPKSHFDYYKKLADYGGEISSDDEPLYYLSKTYQKISVSKETALFHYLEGSNEFKLDSSVILIPFDSNQSQAEAILNALQNKISIIEGPPGTGKTQTILNLIMNLFYRGKTCAVISNNNAAIENIYDKLKEEKLDFIAAKLGSNAHVETFFKESKDETLTSFLKQEESFNPTMSLDKLKKLNQEIKEIQTKQSENAVLELALDELLVEQRKFLSQDLDTVYVNRKLSANEYMSLKLVIESGRRISFIKRFMIGYKFKIKYKKTDLNSLLNTLEMIYYENRIMTDRKIIEENKKRIDESNIQTKIKEAKTISRSLIDKHLKMYYKNSDMNSFTDKTYKQDFAKFIHRYPVILSTSYSVLNNVPQRFLFDYLIIDEASQGDLLSSIAAMACARKILVVGDSKQLQQIEEERLFEKSKELAKIYSIPKHYRYEQNSILSSVKAGVKDVPVTLLKEHYRCAPDIIGFCNKMFYNGKLVPMTKNNGQHIKIVKTVPGNHARKNPYGTGLYNQREIDEIETLINDKNKDDLGIISPFRYQANLISQKYDRDGIESDTVHKFQGRQKNEIILSFVVNALDEKNEGEENKLNDFVTNEKLLNVAISRGVDKVTAIVSDKIYESNKNIISDFIKYAEYLYGNDSSRESQVISVFDKLYMDSKEMLIKKFKINEKDHLSEILMSELIDSVLAKREHIGYSMHIRLSRLISNYQGFTEQEIKYLKHPWTHVDFLFYHKVTKESLFVLEVDGIKYHEQNNKQLVNDEIKDSALVKNGLDVYRFKTNESNEEMRLMQIIEKYI